jgi:hypothetical protein
MCHGCVRACFGQELRLFAEYRSRCARLADLECLALQLTAVHLVDAHHCSDPTKIVSASLLSLNTMMRLELPHVNVLSKIDIAETYGPLRESWTCWH